MSVIAKDGAVIELLKGKNTLLDSVLVSFCVHEQAGEPVVSFLFKMRGSSDFIRIKITFFDVVEYSFYYSCKSIFYNVETLRFLVTQDNNFYLSLDPDESQIDPSDADQDFIKARSVLAEVSL